MIKRTLMPLIAVILILALATGCQYINDKQPTPSPSQPDETTEVPEITASDNPVAEEDLETQSPGEDEGDKEDSKSGIADLTKLFPDKEGYKWVYNGFAEYGHEVVLTDISAEPDKVVYTLEGEVFDMSNGESGFDFSLSVKYTITPDRVVQDKAGKMMLDEFDHMELIAAPLEVGNTWEQTVKNSDGQELTLKCTIEGIKLDGDTKLYTVVYKDINGPYYEKRTIKEGIGVVDYTRLYITSEEYENYEMSYFLYEEASGYDK